MNEVRLGKGAREPHLGDVLTWGGEGWEPQTPAARAYGELHTHLAPTAQIVTGPLRSSDYVEGSSGWEIRGDGSAEFNDVTVRGELIWDKGRLDADGITLDIDDAFESAWIKFGDASNYIRGYDSGVAGVEGIQIVSRPSARGVIDIQGYRADDNSYGRMMVAGGTGAMAVTADLGIHAQSTYADAYASLYYQESGGAVRSRVFVQRDEVTIASYYGGVLVQLGDAAGANKFSVKDSGGSEVASISSKGILSVNFGGSTVGAYFWRNDAYGSTYFEFGHGTTYTALWRFGHDAGIGAFSIYDVNSSAFRMVIKQTGLVGFGGVTAPSYRIELPNTANVYGQGRANQWVTYSDARYKEDVEELAGALDTVMRLRPVRYRPVSCEWGKKGMRRQEVSAAWAYGLVAQELVEVLPEVVYRPKDEEDLWAISYTELIPLLIRGLQEMEERVSGLEGRVQ